MCICGWCGGVGVVSGAFVGGAVGWGWFLDGISRDIRLKCNEVSAIVLLSFLV